MRASELLRQAKALVAREEDWWPGPERDATRLNRVCVMQAVNVALDQLDELIRAGNGAAYDLAVFCISAACDGEPSEGSRFIVWFNDHHSHAEVMAMWERAIDLAEAAEMGAELADIAWAEETEAVMA